MATTKTAKTERYWAERAEQRMDIAQDHAEEAAKIIGEAYLQTQTQIVQDVDKMFQAYQSRYSLSAEEAAAELAAPVGADEYWSLIRRIESMPPSAARKQLEMKAAARPKAYLMSRMEAMGVSVSQRLAELGGTQQAVTASALRTGFGQTYDASGADILARAGVTMDWTSVSPLVVDEAMNARWSGMNYSQRVWRGVDRLDAALQEELRAGIMTGLSANEIAHRIENRMHAGLENARRLVRTEMTYVTNQAEIRSYKELGVTKYMFLATLDDRTSEICQALDGKEVLVKDAKAGVNLPPMHPNCRSTTVPVVDSAAALFAQRIARDKDGKYTYVPGDTRYPQWYEAIQGRAWKTTAKAAKVVAAAKTTSADVVSVVSDALKKMLNPQKTVEASAKTAATNAAKARYVKSMVESKALDLTPPEIIRVQPRVESDPFPPFEPDVSPEFTPDVFPEFEQDVWPEDMATKTASQVRKAVDGLSTDVEKAIMLATVRTGGDGVNYVGQIRDEFLAGAFGELSTYDVIITDRQTRHAHDEHGEDALVVKPYLTQVIDHPELVLEDNKNANTAFFVKPLADLTNGEDDRNALLIVRVQTVREQSGYKNTVITYWATGEDRLETYRNSLRELYNAHHKW
ncbi:MAG: minor capsid protein [Oscillospiraceae bacterium]|nr:minor capsid protein [Oscillospiraceae bacterium]